ncbi:CASP-like protein 4A3 [Dioscorea cayenensis subsp. rotundata]|uniref:CASP-like protein n=1 Tax=Dioscorea cayennensis subsp. rotundata TaxID=55577 RepID=A0AB40CSJ2_DIOCR|nr:CASP-like protein 4A3 [Dioscorea cayenensis subsp. rotundata]
MKNSLSRSVIRVPEHPPQPQSPARAALEESEDLSDRTMNSPSQSPARNSARLKSSLGLVVATAAEVESEKRSLRVVNSPSRSPIRSSEHQQSPPRLITAVAADEELENHIDSTMTNPTLRLPIRDPEHPKSPLRLETVDSATPQAHNGRENQGFAPATSVASFSTWSGTATTAEKVRGNGGTKDRGVFMRRESVTTAVRQGSLALRVLAAALCLISFSVMAADRNKGWAEDSYDKYTEYRYAITVNVLGFLYALFQACVEGKHLIRPDIGIIFNFSMDQILAYLLISASSAAATRADEWVEYWGNDPFPSMARGSAAVSFLAFLVFAMSSLVSAFNFFRRRI